MTNLNYKSMNCLQFSFQKKDYFFIMSSKGLGKWVQKMAIFNREAVAVLKRPMMGTLLLHYEKSCHFAFEQV